MLPEIGSQWQAYNNSLHLVSHTISVALQWFIYNIMLPHIVPLSENCSSGDLDISPVERQNCSKRLYSSRTKACHQGFLLAPSHCLRAFSARSLCVLEVFVASMWCIIQMGITATLWESISKCLKGHKSRGELKKEKKKRLFWKCVKIVGCSRPDCDVEKEGFGRC